MSNPPILDWHDGQPVSAQFGDVYFSRASGIEETRHVFLRHNRLAERWQSLQATLFTIAETGFGTGLNFLCAWQLWNLHAPRHARLHFVSTEKYPLSREELQQALSLWPELSAFSAALIEQYRWLAPGFHRLVFGDGRVTLTLLIGDARETLPQLRAGVDAWFLDGFSPAKNPEMWQEALLGEVARLSSPGATFATFTSAGAVRRGLQAVGFDVRKVPGHGSKRDMLCGELPAENGASPSVARRQAVVVGGGIAGCASAWHLARRGWQVTLIERHAGLASEASGNPQGVLYPRFSGHDIPLSRAALSGFLHTRRLLPQLSEAGVDWDDCGLLQLAFDAREVKRQQEVAGRGLPSDLLRPVDRLEASRLAGVQVEHDGLWLPTAGWVRPAALCQALCEHPDIEVMVETRALRLNAQPCGWQVIGASGTLAEAEAIILCTANDSVAFDQTAHLPLLPVRGQTTQVPATAASLQLRSVLCADGYISPARDGTHCLGATFAPEDRSLRLSAEDHQANLAMLRQLSPALHQALDAPTLDPQTLAGRAALRSATPDYLPMAGPLLDAVSTLDRYSEGSRLGAEHLPWLHGLYVNVGHGSKGLLTAPLAGELIAALLENEPLPVDIGLARAFDPNRFLLRGRGLKRLIGAAFG